MTQKNLHHRSSMSITVDRPILVGLSQQLGRRQLIPILSGKVTGGGLHGLVLLGDVDSQIIVPDGICQLYTR
ncbi:DUF3237 family protein [Streptococcus caprae]|uniref:DUF3237 family protein n=1 Tax=Streptococcus caprae TaxID=1640501 RepID=A0ABV8CWV7_9STRE